MPVRLNCQANLSQDEQKNKHPRRASLKTAREPMMRQQETAANTIKICYVHDDRGKLFLLQMHGTWRKKKKGWQPLP